MYIFAQGGRQPAAQKYQLCYSSIETLAGLTGFLTAVQNEKEWIISNTAETNSTNLSFSSHGSRFALSEEGVEGEEEGSRERREKVDEDSQKLLLTYQRLSSLFCIAVVELLAVPLKVAYTLPLITLPVSQLDQKHICEQHFTGLVPVVMLFCEIKNIYLTVAAHF